jgi:RNA polymerase sigma-70 factor (ECF subfamily)
MDWRGKNHSLEPFRAYLHLLGRLELDPCFLGKLDLSGVVQQTLAEAALGESQFLGKSRAELLVWLRRIFTHNLTDEIRRCTAQRRDVHREQSLQASFEESSARVEAWLASEDSSPSHRASREEELLRLAEALALLPADQRLAVELHHLRGLSLAETAQRMERSRGAVASLIFRGLARLRKQMNHEGMGDGHDA